MLTDDAIVQAVRVGQRDAVLAQVVAEYRRKVYGLVLSMVRDAALADDVAQDVFVKVWRALPAYDGRARFSTWLYTITRNAAVSALRRRRDHLSLSDEATYAEAELALAARAARVGDAAAGVADGGSGADGVALDRAIARLPEKQQQVVTLFYLQERSYEEVAEMLAMPLGTVKTLLHRARSRLQEQLAAERREGVRA